ncbi:MAG: phosphatidylserine/phosphatidylglycerophosphate/cardiolipin synthase family protein [Methylotenera sp.]|nr:phosphatidylserine/phosphatidylglycerophosphate/cardiolipin synthase family protein [Oligoflexia bacterium]
MFKSTSAASVLILAWFSLALLSTSAICSDVRVSEAPGNDLALTVETLKSARSSIFLNIYDLTSQKVADALIERIHSGVKVEILEEGAPVSGLSSAAREIQKQLVAAMRTQSASSNHLYEMIQLPGRSGRRFRFDHAKYAVIDGAALLIGSENYSPTGNPEPGSIGNRGWEVLVSDPALASDFHQLFLEDSDLTQGDVRDLTVQSPSRARNGAVSANLAGPGLNAFPVLHASKVETILSPESSLSGLLSLITHAGVSIDLQQMTFDSAWNGADRSPLVDALVSAAKRGVQIRVLLNDDHTFDKPGKPARPRNRICVDLLNQLAQRNGKPNLTARIANVKAMGVDYIHNKGALIDGRLTLVSSINWDYNSILNNREAAIVLTSPEIFNHYEKIFSSDWVLSASTNRR